MAFVRSVDKHQRSEENCTRGGEAFVQGAACATGLIVEPLSFTPYSRENIGY